MLWDWRGVDVNVSVVFRFLGLIHYHLMHSYRLWLFIWYGVKDFGELLGFWGHCGFWLFSLWVFFFFSLSIDIWYEEWGWKIRVEVMRISDLHIMKDKRIVVNMSLWMSYFLLLLRFLVLFLKVLEIFSVQLGELVWSLELECISDNSYIFFSVYLWLNLWEFSVLF